MVEHATMSANTHRTGTGNEQGADDALFRDGREPPTNGTVMHMRRGKAGKGAGCWEVRGRHGRC